MMYKTGILCLLLGGLVPFAEALPLWIRPDAKSGAFQVEQVQVRLSHFNTKWIGVEQKGGAVTGKATNSPEAFSFKGNWKVGNDSFTLEESIRRISGDTVEYRAKVFSDRPVDTSSIRLNFVLPLEIVKDRSVRIGKERLRYSKEVSKKVHPFSRVEVVEIELPEGTLEIRCLRLTESLRSDCPASTRRSIRKKPPPLENFRRPTGSASTHRIRKETGIFSFRAPACSTPI